MKHSLIAGGAAGALSATLVFFGLQSVQPGQADASERTAAGPQAASPAEGRLDELGDDVRQLQNQLAMMENSLSELRGLPAGQLAARAPVGGDLAEFSAAELEALRTLASAAGPDGLPPVAGGDYIAVKSTLAQIREDEEAEKAIQRRERGLERIEENLTRLTDSLGLVGYQIDGMRDALVEEMDARDALMTEARENDDWGSMREGMREIRDTQQTAIEELLGPDLYAQYEEEDGGGFGGFGGFGGGRGGRGGGRGGGGSD